MEPFKEALKPEGSGSDSDPCHSMNLDKVHAYGLTIKPCSVSEIKQCTEDPRYLPITILTKFLYDNHFKLKDSKIEYDSKNVQHIHATFISQTKIRLYRNIKLKNYHIHIEKIYNLQRWLSYCQKDEFNKEELQYYKTEYAFI